METRIVTALAKGNAREVGAALAGEVLRELGGRPRLAMVFASTKQPLGELLAETSERLGPDTVLLGASTAGEFTERGDAKGSAAIFAVIGDFEVHAGMATGLKANVEASVEKAVGSLPRSIDGFGHVTTVLLLDPLAGKGEEAALLVGAMLGGGTRLAGGAAGDDLGMKETHVGLGRHAASDALVVASIFSKQPLGVGVCHGHLPISDGLRVTKADGNVVREIDGRPAWQVWAQHTRGAAMRRNVDPDHLAASDVGAFLLRYEAGLETGDSFKIRAPLARQDDGSLMFACGIPEGATIRITESEPDRQVTSAREAAKRALAQMGAPAAGAVVFDCICRNLILGDKFATAVQAIANELGDVPVAGFETYGEIALDAGDMSGFHNTTTVVLAFPR